MRKSPTEDNRPKIKASDLKEGEDCEQENLMGGGERLDGVIAGDGILCPGSYHNHSNGSEHSNDPSDSNNLDRSSCSDNSSYSSGERGGGPDR